MKPKSKSEKEVVKLSSRLPAISERQKKWALGLVSLDRSFIFRRRKACISHFVIATTKSGWQVLRHYYLYAYYRRKELVETQFCEVMEQWYKGGEYIFMSRSRCMGYCNDAWAMGKPMEVRRGVLGGYCLCDPRDIGYEAIRVERLLSQFRYIPVTDKFDEMIRACNTHPFNETMYKLYPDAWRWSVKNDFIYDKEKTSALKIAIRYKYDFKNTLWRDMIEMLHYLKKDLHNPKLVCPENLKEAHDRWSFYAMNKRKKNREKMARLRQIANEHQLLLLERQRQQRMEEIRETAIESTPYYEKARKAFFNLSISGKGIEINTLRSVDEFYEEGKVMGHCVFSMGYYDVKKKPNSLILSARKNGERLETIEVDLSDFHVVQSRGKFNSQTPYHNEILNLMNENMNQIKKIARKNGKTNKQI